MKTYRVEVREVWVQAFLVEANSPEDAVMRMFKGEGDCLDNPTDAENFSYSHTLDSDQWTIKEAAPDEAG